MKSGIMGALGMLVLELLRPQSKTLSHRYIHTNIIMAINDKIKIEHTFKGWRKKCKRTQKGLGRCFSR